MKPLVYYCRWQRGKLRLHGRDEESVWGEIVTETAEGNVESQKFRYLLGELQLILIEQQGDRVLQLDEMGIPLPDDG